jgi:arginine/ornithine transport system substrate-binding protein
MKKLLLAVALTSVATFANAQNQDLRVAVELAYEPFTYKSPDGQPTGFDVDIAKAICAEIKRKCVFVEQVWDSMIPGLIARKYDVIISSMSITDERKKVVDFSDKYYNTPSRIVMKEGMTTDATFAGMKGKRIGVLKGSTQEKFANGELKKAGATVVPYAAQDQVYLDLKAGRLDGTVADQVEVQGGFLSKPDGKGFAFTGPVLNDPKYVKYFGVGVGVAMRKGETQLRNEINQAIKTIRSNGVYKQINDKYFDFDAYGQ